MIEQDDELVSMTDYIEGNELENERGYIMLGDWYLTEYPSFRVPRNVTLKIENAHVFSQKQFIDLKSLNHTFTFKFL